MSVDESTDARGRTRWATRKFGRCSCNCAACGVDWRRASAARGNLRGGGEELLAAGYTVMIETSGERFVGRLPQEVIKIVDVKCPDSGEADTFESEESGGYWRAG